MENEKVLKRGAVAPHLEEYEVCALVNDSQGPMKAGEVGVVVDVTICSDGNHQYVVMPQDPDRLAYSVFSHAQLAPYAPLTSVAPSPPQLSIPPRPQIRPPAALQEAFLPLPEDAALQDTAQLRNK